MDQYQSLHKYRTCHHCRSRLAHRSRRSHLLSHRRRFSQGTVILSLEAHSSLWHGGMVKEKTHQPAIGFLDYPVSLITTQASLEILVKTPAILLVLSNMHTGPYKARIIPPLCWPLSRRTDRHRQLVQHPRHFLPLVLLWSFLWNVHFRYQHCILRNRTKISYHLSDHHCLLNLPLSRRSNLQTVRQKSELWSPFPLTTRYCVTLLGASTYLILAIHAVVDFQPSIPPLRGYGSSSQLNQNNQPDRRYQEYLSNSPDDNNLDPVSALLRAGEIVDRSERNQGGRGSWPCRTYLISKSSALSVYERQCRLMENWCIEELGYGGHTGGAQGWNWRLEFR